jgi:hypothetical protein
MTRQELITKAMAGQLSWVQAADIAGVSRRQMRRISRASEYRGMSAVMDQRGGRPAQADLRWYHRDAGPAQARCFCDFSLSHFYEQVTGQHSVKVVSYN